MLHSRCFINHALNHFLIGLNQPPLNQIYIDTTINQYNIICIFSFKTFFFVFLSNLCYNLILITNNFEIEKSSLI